MFSMATSQFQGANRTARRVLLAGGLALAALLVPGATIAASPTIERIPISFDLRLNLTSDLICGFEVWQRGSGTILVQTRTDGGTVTERDITPGTFESIFYSRDSGGLPTGKELVAHSAGVTTLTVKPDGSFAYAESGSHDRITIAGSGIVMGTIGHAVDIYQASADQETIRIAGHNQISFDSLANLCDPLRPSP
jgi:hypothetical protein